MATRKIKDAKDLSTQELIYFKGHAKATFMSDGATVEDAVRAVENATYKNKGYFPTLAELQSAFPKGSAGSRAYVGSTYPYSIYLWQNGAWVDSGATGGDESVDLASYYTKSETDTKLTELSEEIGLTKDAIEGCIDVTESINLANPAKYTDGYIMTKFGTPSAASSSFYMEKMAVQSGERIYMTLPRSITAYNADGAAVSSQFWEPNIDAWNESSYYEVPNGISYIVITGYKSRLPYMVNKGDTLLPYQEYKVGYEIRESALPVLPATKIEGLTEIANKTFGKITESFTSQSANVVQGYVVSNGDLADSSSYYRTLPIKVYGGETIVVSTKILSASACGVAFYSSAEINKLNKIGDAYLVGAGTYENYEVVVPNQAQYVVISFAYNYNAKLTHLSETESAFFTKEEIEKKVIVDSLDNESNINALSAKQGKLLNETKADIEFVSDKVQQKDTLPLVINATEGYWDASGIFVAESGRLSTEKFKVKGGTVIYISTYLGSTEIPMLVEYDADGGFIRYQKMGTGVADILVDYETTLHKNTCYVAINSARRATTPSAYQIRYELEPKFYTKEETQGKLLYKKYGLRWKIDDYSDLGERMFDAVGLSAEIGIGATKGASDFDSIFPWSEMKRCNIKSNANGAKIVTYEGEDGFTLDGSNGDVFVRIPKFFVEKYQKDGYEYRVISEMGNLVHPLFVENGEILDEVYVSAFEGYIDNDKMRSIANVIPSNNRIPFVFLDAAKANGEGYTLYDSRCVDAIWTLFAVEFGCRNVSYIIGYGCSRFLQPVNGQYKTIQVAASATNTIKLENPNGKRNGIYDQMMVGTTITICKGDQSNILTQALITNVNLDSEYAEITFDGAPIDVDTTCFCGNAPQMTNWAETCNGALSWHTGRALRTGFNWGLESVAEKTLNPMRYRWIENINGNIWKFLPDITFNECQMYVCKNISDYEFHKTSGAYKPVHNTLTPQNINGGLNDKRIPNSDYTDGSSWIDKLIVEPFAKGISIGQSFTGNMLSSEGFGANYQLRNALVCIASGGGFDHGFRCNILTMRAQITEETIWYLYGARLMYKPM